MTTAYTSLLGFALPVTGELSGTWGATVNDAITQLVEDSVANYATQSVTSANWTLTTTGSGASNQARMAILIPTGTPGVSRNIVAPSSSKAYIVVNQSDFQVVLKGSATTGTIIPTNSAMLCAWNGTDFTSITVMNLSAGTTAQRPATPAAGMIRYNTTLTQFEGYNGSAWNLLGGAVISNDTSTATTLYPLFSSVTTGNALTLYTSNAKLLYKPSMGEFSSTVLNASNGIVVNSATISESYTVASGSNAMSAGPVSIASGQSVTVASGSRWVVV